MSKLFEQLGKILPDNPKVERLLAAALRDGLSVAKIPSEIAGDIKRGLAEVGESAAGVVQSGAKLVDDFGPEIRFGEKGGSVSLLDPTNLIPLDASEIANVMGDVKESARKASEEPTAAEVTYDTMIEAIDGKLQRLEEGGDAAPAAAPKRAAAAAPAAASEPDDDEGLDFSALGDLLKEKLGGVAESLKDPVGSAKSLKDKYVGAVGDKVSDLTEGISTSDELFEEYYDTPAGEAKIAAAPKAEVVSEDYEDQAIALFKNTHGTSFDPKSSMDRGKLEKMKSMLADMGGLGGMTPNQFALQVYRNS